MIALQDLYYQEKESLIENLNLEIPNSQLYTLLCNDAETRRLFLRFFCGSVCPDEGEIQLDGRQLSPDTDRDTIACIERITDMEEFDTDTQVRHWLAFLGRILHFSRSSLLEMLIKFNFPEECQKKRVKELDPDLFRMLYASIQFARPCSNWVIHDFCKGSEKRFELKFNRLLMQKRDLGHAVLYLTNDIFLASEIADRVGFLKNGMLIFETNADELKEMDFKELYQKFLS